MSHGSSMGRDKGMSDGQTGVKRKVSDDRHSRSTKPSVDAFPDDLETQNSELPNYAARGQEYPPPHLSHYVLKDWSRLYQVQVYR